MSNYTYKCVPVPSVIDTGKKGKALHGHAVSTYESIINQAAQGGWELTTIDDVSSSQKPGCLGVFFGGKEEVVTFKMLIFRKEKPRSVSLVRSPDKQLKTELPHQADVSHDTTPKPPSRFGGIFEPLENKAEDDGD